MRPYTQRDFVRLHQLLHRLLQHLLQKLGCPFAEPLIQALRAKADPQGSRRLRQGFQAGLRIGQPAKHQRLDQFGPAEGRLALHKATRPPEALGRFLQDHLHALSNLRYGCHREALWGIIFGLATAMMPQKLPFVIP